MKDSGGPISLLLICHSYPPVLGGSEMEAQRVCSELVKRGHRVQVLCAGGDPMPRTKHWIDPLGVPVRIWGNGLPARWCGYAFAAGVAWTLFRGRKQYQIAYFLMSGLQIATGMPVARFFRKPILMKFSGSGTVACMRASWLARLELSMIRRWASRLLVLNPGMIEEAASVGLDRDDIMLMPNPVDADEFAPPAPEVRARLRRELDVPGTCELAVFVGRLAPEKELISLVKAFAEVAARLPDALLALIGDGPDRDALVALTRVLQLERNVRFVGSVSHQNVRRWMQAADVFALVSSLEGLPCALIEAMSVGLPSVVSDIPANRQLIDDGAQGLFVRPRDESHIAGQVIRLLSDGALRQHLGRQARERALARYATPKVVEQYERLFREMLSARAAGCDETGQTVSVAR